MIKNYSNKLSKKKLKQETESLRKDDDDDLGKYNRESSNNLNEKFLSKKSDESG